MLAVDLCVLCVLSSCPAINRARRPDSPEKPSEMDFQRRLLDVSKSLSTDELKALAFLCADLLGRSTSADPNELFSRLQEQDYLSEERPHLLTELLVTLRRNRLVSELNLNCRQPAARDLISPFRKLLYELSEEITDEGLREMKFLLHNTLPRRALDENATLDVFLEMERMDRLSDNNLAELETIIQSVCPVLREKINQFKAQLVCPTRPIAQESEAYFPPNRGPLSSPWQHQVRTDALEISEEKEISVPIQSERRNTEGLESYPMTAAKRGICLIINNYDFTNSEGFLNREGTKIDEQCLVDVFHWLSFETQVRRDCTSEQMQELLRQLGQSDHSQMDSVVCCILTHGMEGTVLGVDGIPVKLADLSEPLNGSKCSSLANKPKLFFIQACQGTDTQRLVCLESDGPTDGSLCTDAVPVTSIPADADFLFAMSTVPSFVSFRDKRTGSWFIQSLCQSLAEMVPRGSDLVSILTQVNADVSQKTHGLKKQMPQPRFTLRKRVVFPPPTAPPPRLSSV